MITRALQPTLLDFGRGFPIITITGPRQSGKTTLAKMAYPKYKYIDLENLALRQIANDDPGSLFPDTRGFYILDEFQYAPGILSHLKQLVDVNQIDNQFILTGSNQFALMKDVSQSLAGRTAIFELLPLSVSEAFPSSDEALNQVLYRGLYPRLIARNMNPAVFYDSYIRTYLQRDIRQLTNIQNLDTFTRFFGLCAGRTGCILNKHSLANDTGVDTKTIGNWLSILQASYIIHLLPPWYGNLSKRLIKSPKLYFYDTGLACRLLQIRSTNDLSLHPLRGQLFETFIVAEVVKFFHNRGIRPPLSYYRDSNGMEIDLIIDQGSKLIPLEIKAASQINSSFHSNISRFKALNLRTSTGRLVYAGDHSWSNDVCRNLSWRDLGNEIRQFEPGVTE